MSHQSDTGDSAEVPLCATDIYDQICTEYDAGRSLKSITGSDALVSLESKNLGEHSVANDGQNRTSRVSRELKTWNFEVIAMIFSALAMAAVGVILITVDNRPLSHWKLPISPNALVSTFVTVSNSAMLYVLAQGLSQLKWVYFRQRKHRLMDLDLFDSASRGPLGSLQLSWSIRWKAAVASLGALLTVLAMAIDPLAQQILRYSSALAASSFEVATLQTAHVYDPRGGDLDTIGETIYEELLTPGARQGLICSTGNCTWEPFETLGIRSTCLNVTEFLLIECDWRVSPPHSWSQYYERNISCHYDVNGSNITNFAAGFFTSVDTVSNGGNPLLRSQPWLDTDTTPVSILRFPSGYFSTLSDWATVHQPLSPNETGWSLEWLSRGFNEAQLVPHGFHCLFNWYILTYSVSLQSGKLQENVLSAKPFPVQFGPESDVINNSKFTLGVGAFYVMDAMIETMFDVYIYNSNVYDGGIHLPPVHHILMYGNGGAIDQSVASITHGITNAIRRGPNSTEIHGTAFVTETIVNVQWAWFTLPTALVVFAACFFATAAVFSAQDGAHAWKSSTLPFYFIGSQGLREGFDHASNLKDMERESKLVSVQLRTDQNGRHMFVED